MPTINEYKKSTLNTMGYNGSINDAEYKWLRNQVAPYKGAIPDMWMKYLYNRGYTTGPIQNRMKNYLTDLGYSGALPNMLYQYWKNGAAPAWAAGSNLWADFTIDGVNGDTLNSVTDTHAQTIYAPNAAGVYTAYGANVLTRTDLGLQTVPTRTNLCIRSQEFDDAAWSKTGATVTPNTAVAPDGATTADTYAEDTGNTQHILASTAISFANTTVYTGSVYAKAGTQSLIQLTFSAAAFSGLGYANFDLSTGTVVGSGGTLVSSSIVSVGNGWYLCSIVATSTAAASSTFAVSQIAIAASGRLPTYVGTSRTVFVWQAQVEAGAFASPPIVTAGASAAVNGNQQVLSGLGTQLATGVAWLSDIDPLGFANNDSVFSISDGTNSNRIQVQSSSGNLRLLATAGGVDQATVVLGTTPTSRFVMAGIWTANYVMGRIVGVSAPSPDTSGTYPTVDRVGFGAPTPPNNQMYMRTRKLALDFLTPSDDPATKFAEWYAKAQLAAA